ncbi:hypothetical protein D0868_12222 [Hortaea werneckii]|uniref:Uncharacterized protein n=1 Tax=Hortaea werneckii TaxID=91943 RepID=A0A3M6XUV8_HORWE|nr:hypothetical protein D0868_12222 [Hortaea werneckii]
MQQCLLAASLAVVAYAARSTDLNLDKSIAPCDALLCGRTVNETGICAPRTPDSTIARGVGMVSDAVNLRGSNTSLSFTLTDGETRGVNVGATGTTFSTVGLYVGAPEDADLANHPPACSLLFQFQGQTFPETSTENYENTTFCPYAFRGVDNSCLENWRDTIRTFEYSADSYPSWSRCEALAQYVEHSMQEIGSDSRDLQTTCSYLASLDYNLHRIAYAREPLSFNSSVIDEGLDLGLGGRTGYTPVVNVLYSQEDDTEPEVTFLCMRTYTPDGGELPGSRLQYNGASMSNGFSTVMATVASGALLWFILY